MFELLILAVLIPALLTVPEWAQRDFRRWLRRCGRHSYYYVVVVVH